MFGAESCSHALPLSLQPISVSEPFVRIVLSNIGTFGDINPLIALALELKRRGHLPVMALPNVYRPKIEPLGLTFQAVRPDIDPTDKALIAMIYDVKKGNRDRPARIPLSRFTADVRRPACGCDSTHARRFDAPGRT